MLALNLLLFSLLVVTTAAEQTPFPSQIESKNHHDCISFEEFMEQVHQAKYEDYKDTDVESKEAFEEMRAHILYMYQCVTKVTSFVQEQGYTDCIKILEQPSFCHGDLKQIPHPPLNSSHPEKTRECVPGVFRDTDSPLKLGLKDRCGHPISCPEGTIPMSRLTLEKLTRYPTLRHFLSRRFPQRPLEAGLLAGNPHKYAHATQNVLNFGGNSWLNVWSPTGYTDEFMSISQQWYWGGAFNTLNHQTVEGGWQVEPRAWNTNKAVLFIYWTADNYTKTGCYNTECTGFHQINNNWHFGNGFTHYSTQNGTQWGFEMQWKLYQRNWWLFLKGPGDYEAVGFYPTSIYNGGQLSRQAQGIDYGGETWTKTLPNYPNMGSGAFASSGWKRAAFQNQIFWIPKDENDGYGVWAKLNKDQPSPSCYTIDVTDSISGGDWGTYFFFGGPGKSGC